MGPTALWGIAHLEGITENRNQTLTTYACDAPRISTHHPGFFLHRKDDKLTDRIEEDVTKVLPLLGQAHLQLWHLGQIGREKGQ